VTLRLRRFAFLHVDPKGMLGPLCRAIRSSRTMQQNFIAECAEQGAETGVSWSGALSHFAFD
jgi:hypothetical protein